MYAVFRTEPPVGVTTIHQERCGGDASLVTSRDFLKLDIEPALFGPAEEHPQKHVRPILRVGTTFTRLDFADCIGVVVLAGEERSKFEFAEIRHKRGHRFLDFCLDRFIVFFAPEFMQRLGVFESRRQLVE